MDPKKDKIKSEKTFLWKRIFLNKYLIVLILFAVWMIFFDQNSYFIHKELDKEYRELSKQKDYYENKLTEETIQIKKMKTDPDAVEKVAREKHFLKKEDEDVFIIEKRKVKKNEVNEKSGE